MKYEKLTDDEKAAMLDNRLRQYEQEHYNHSINVALLRASGAADDATLAQIAVGETAMATLDAAHANTKAELAKVKPKKP